MKGKHQRKPMKTMDRILVIVGLTLAAYTVTVLVMSTRYITVPSELTVAVFSVCGGECGIMGWIKTTKERAQERQWAKEDSKASESESQYESQEDLYR